MQITGIVSEKTKALLAGGRERQPIVLADLPLDTSVKY